MGASDWPPRPPRPSEHPQTNGHAVLEPPPRPPPALSAEQDPRGKAPILVVIHTKEANLLGRRFVLDRSPVFVGRAVENHIILHDARVSPRHAHFEARGAAWWCIDDGSTEGVYVDDQRTTEAAALAHGTRIGIGSTIFRFLSGKEAEAQYHEDIYRMTICDALTQVYVKRYLVEALDKEILRARRHDRPLSLLMIEVDELSTLPPQTGDDVLRKVAALLRRSVQRDWVLARYSGECFVVLLPEHTIEAACGIAESLRDEVANLALAVGAGGAHTTVCIGGAQHRGDDRVSAHILERASRALHAAKSRGRNQLECMVVDEGPDAGPGI